MLVSKRSRKLSQLLKWLNWDFCWFLGYNTDSMPHFAIKPNPPTPSTPPPPFTINTACTNNNTDTNTTKTHTTNNNNSNHYQQKQTNQHTLAPSETFTRMCCDMLSFRYIASLTQILFPWEQSRERLCHMRCGHGYKYQDLNRITTSDNQVVKSSDVSKFPSVK